MPVPSATVVHRDKASFQQQYGTLWKAAEAYLDGTMLEQQARSFENLIDPQFLGAVALTRLMAALIGR
jgi:hypothetical protein